MVGWLERKERIPPGQYVTDKWPVLTYGTPPEVDLESWELRVFGLVEKEIGLDWSEFRRLPRKEVTADFHCVTRFSTLDNPWEGVSTRTVLELAKVHPEACHVLVHCYGGYTTNLLLEDFLSDQALFADTHNGRPLAREHGGPVRLVVPHLYAWKSAKWVSGVELLAEERRGFWEQNGYHTRGDPWAEERFSHQEVLGAGEIRRRAKDLHLVPESGSHHTRK